MSGAFSARAALISALSKSDALPLCQFQINGVMNGKPMGSGGRIAGFGRIRQIALPESRPKATVRAAIGAFRRPLPALLCYRQFGVLLKRQLQCLLP